MKEISIEEKARYYDEALTKAKELAIDGYLDAVAISDIFPELKESEGERIRKTLIYHYQGDGCICTNEYRIDYKDIRAWLEKQCQTFTKKDVDDAYLKGVCDAKQELEKQGEQKPYGQRNECLDCQFNYAGECKGSCAMKRSEQKPTEWSSEQKHTLQTNDVPYKSSTDTHLWTRAIGFDGEPMESKQTEQKPVNTDYISGIRKELLSIEDNAENINGLTESQWVAIRAAHRLLGECIVKEQTSAAWSEEDKKKLSDILALLWGGVNRHYNAPDLSTWLKSLKDRVQPQQKQEWSYNDEIIIETIIQEIEKIPSEKFIDNAKCRCLDWLRYRTKSLRPQSQWKPSDEQMEALRYVTNFDYGGHKATLVSLYEQLKKLGKE